MPDNGDGDGVSRPAVSLRPTERMSVACERIQIAGTQRRQHPGNNRLHLWKDCLRLGLLLCKLFSVHSERAAGLSL